MNKFFYCLFILCYYCKPISQNSNKKNIKYSPLTINSHASEGGFARINKNTIIVIYRKDSSLAHVSNNSKIVSKTSINNGESWNNEQEVYNSPYDDRNLIVGNLPNGNIIVVFRRYNANKKLAIDSGYIISTDNGITWSKYTKINGTENNNNQPFGSIINKGKETSFLICFKKGIVKIYNSTNNFTDKPKESTIINDSTKVLQEPFLVNISNNKKIILCRNGSGKLDQTSFYQYNYDNGNYYYKGETNIFKDHKTSVRSPASLRYDPKTNLLEVCVTSRVFKHTSKNIDNELRFYTQNADSVFNNPNTYQIKFKASRPIPNNHWFYGYPKFLNLSHKEILYLITDSKLNNPKVTPITHIDNEQANLYTFKIKI